MTLFPMRASAVPLAGSLLLGLFSPALVAQIQPEKAEPIRVQVDLVPVDVIVIDNRGRPVLDLAREDFVVLEKGVPQEIRHFSLQRFGIDSRLQAQSEETQSPAAEPEADQLDSQQYRTFLILLGRGRHNKFGTLGKVMDFVREDLAPSDQVAVMAYNRSTRFTTDRDSIAEILRRYKERHQEIEGSLEVRLTGLAAVYGRKDIPRSLQGKIDAVFDVPNLVSRRVIPADMENPEQQRDERRAMEIDLQSQRVAALADVAAEGLTDQPEDLFAELHNAELDLMTDLPFDEYMAARAQTDQELMNLFGALEYLRLVEGEKHLLFFSEKGLFLPDLEDDKSLASLASDARVRIHNLHTGGVELRADVTLRSAEGSTPQFARYRTPRFRGSATGSFALASLRNVSSLTGGRAYISADMDRALDSIQQSTAGSYLLGYRPQNTNFEGDYRRIRVQVRRKGVRVFARGGYYARSDIEPYDRQQLMTYTRTVNAATYSDPIDDVSFDLAVTEPQLENEITRFDVVLRINLQEQMFQTQDQLHLGNFAITFFLFTDDGKFLADQWDTMQLNFDQDTYDRMLRTGLPIKRTLRFAGELEKALLKAVIYDVNTDKLGSQQAEVRPGLPRK